MGNKNLVYHEEMELTSDFQEMPGFMLDPEIIKELKRQYAHTKRVFVTDNGIYAYVSPISGYVRVSRKDGEHGI